MNLDTQSMLVLAYLLPIALAAWLLSDRASRRGGRLVGLLLILPVFYIGHYLLIEQLQGWPSRGTLPDSFRLLAHEIIEPNPRTGDAGRILIWAQPDGAADPRVHEIDYDAALHHRLSAAAQRQAAGRPQRGAHRHSAETADDNAGPEQVRTLLFDDIEQQRLPPKTADR